MTAPTLTPADFLLARIAEEEAVANSVPNEGTHLDDEWELWTSLVSTTPRGERLGPRGSVEATPARVLAECEARRLIVANHGHTLTSRGCDCEMHDDLQSYMDCDVCVEAGQYADSGGWCLTLRLLAAPYADHPDYREEWAA